MWLPAHPRFQVEEGTLFASEDPSGRQSFLSRPSPCRLGGAALAGLFRELARRWGLSWSPSAEKNLARLEDPGARLVITGQQPGFLTGPLFTFFKAASVAGLAGHLEARRRRPYIPVLWVAGEDHDLEEARSACFPGAGAAGHCFQLPQPADRRPLSSYAIDAETLRVVAAVKEHLGGRRRAEEAFRLLDHYRAGRTLSSACGAVLADLLAPWGLLVIEPEALRPHSRPIIERALQDPEGLMRAVRRGVEEVESLGLRAQVPERFPLFLLEEGAAGRRHHLEPVSGGFRAGGSGEFLTTARSLDILKEAPERFSTGVLLRPVVQEALLPVEAAVGGPAEVAYFAQLGPVFEHFGLSKTPMVLRFSASLLEGKVCRAMERLGIGPGSLEALLRARNPQDLIPAGQENAAERLLAELRPLVGERLRDAVAAARLSAGEAERLHAGAREIVKSLERFQRRLQRMVEAVSGERMSAASTVWNHLFPGGVLQERKWNVFHFLAKYGREWVAAVVEEVQKEPFQVRHSWGMFDKD